AAQDHGRVAAASAGHRTPAAPADPPKAPGPGRSMSRLLWIVLALIGGGLLVLVLNHDSGETFGLRNDAFARTLYLGVWALVIGAALIGARIPFGQAARGAAIWIAVLLMLVAAYQYRHELNEVASRVGAGFLPGRPVS